MKKSLSKITVAFLPLTASFFIAVNLSAQESTTKFIQKTAVSIEIDPIVPAVFAWFFRSRQPETKNT